MQVAELEEQPGLEVDAEVEEADQAAEDPQTPVEFANNPPHPMDCPKGLQLKVLLDRPGSRKYGSPSESPESKQARGPLALYQ